MRQHELVRHATGPSMLYDEHMEPGLDYSVVAEHLMVGKTPHSHDYPMLRQHGVRLIINMQLEHYAWSAHSRSGIRTLWVPTIDWWLFPIYPWYVMSAVRRALAVIEQGGTVYCHCRQGRHRSILLAACILIAQGNTVAQTMTTLKQSRAVADPEAPHIYRSIRAFAARWERCAG